jgi:hypothetical protein
MLKKVARIAKSVGFIYCFCLRELPHPERAGSSPRSRSTYSVHNIRTPPSPFAGVTYMHNDRATPVPKKQNFEAFVNVPN